MSIRLPFSLRSAFWLPHPVEEVFPYFADAHNLEELTPAFLHFQVLTPAPIPMRPGTRIDYRLRLRGIPIRWQSEITVWEPPARFVDEQRRGPYRAWVHEHRFTPKDGGTWVEDEVRYDVWGGALVNALLVKKDVAMIFAYREKKLRERFGGSGTAPTGSSAGAAP